MPKIHFSFSSARSSAEYLFVPVALILVFFITLRSPNDTDMWWHLRNGRETIVQRMILTTDQFSYTRAGQPWTNAFWLADLAMYAIFVATGFPGLAVTVSLLAVIAMWVVYKQMNGLVAVRMMVILLSSLALSRVWSARPQILSFLLLAILDSGLQWRNSFIRNKPWILPLLFMLWANLHGGFIWGFLLLAAVLIGAKIDQFAQGESSFSSKQFKDLVIWGLTAAAAVCINPNGPSLWKLPFYTVSVVTNIEEWASPDFHRLDLQPMLWLLFLLIAGLAFARRVVRWESLLKVLGFSYLGFISQRNIGPFAMIAAPVVAHYLSYAVSELAVRAPGLRSIIANNKNQFAIPPILRLASNAIIIFSLVGLSIFRAQWLLRPSQIYFGFPKDAVDWLKQHHPEGRLFSTYNWGGFLTFELPQYPVFIDGRTDLYGNEYITQWQEIMSGSPQGIKLLDDWDIKLILVEPGRPLLNTLIGWKLLYKDDNAVIYGR